MSQRKVLYSILVSPGRERTLLDAIRLFAKPSAKYPAHVTVRGPYSESKNLAEWNDQVRGELIEVGGVGTFFEGTQNTVFLKVDSPAVRGVWDKPDYPDYNPHLTICDPPDRPFAEAVLAIVITHVPRFSFRAHGLVEMVLGNDRSLLREEYEAGRLAGYMERPPTIADIDAAHESTRLGWIGELAAHLAFRNDNSMTAETR